MYLKLLEILFLLFIVNLSKIAGALYDPLSTLYQWKYFDFDWDDATKQQFIEAGWYNFSLIVPIDVDQAPDGRTFVTLIRGPGVPSTLNVVTKKVESAGPLLRPYPNWAWNTDLKCNGLTNVYRVAIDKCNHLWVLDTGMFNGQRVCPSQLLKFGLTTNTLKSRKIIPNNIATNSRTGQSLLIQPVVDYEPDDDFCEKPKVYMADVLGNGLVVMDEYGKFYRIESPKFVSEPNYQTYQIGSHSFQLPDGLFGLTVTPYLDKNVKYLIFRPLGSLSIYLVLIRDVWRAARGAAPLNFVGNDNVLPYQASMIKADSRGILFYASIQDTAIGCWNAYNLLDSKNLAIIIQDFTRLQFVSGLKIIQNYLGQEEFLIMTNRYQKLATATIDFNEINFRILKANVDSVIRGTKCDRKLKHHDDHDDYFWLGEHSNNHTQIEDRPVHDTPNYDEQSDYYG